MNYFAISCPSQFQDPQVGPCRPKMGPRILFEKNLHRILGYRVPDVPEQKSALKETWFSNNQRIYLELTSTLST